MQEVDYSCFLWQLPWKPYANIFRNCEDNSRMFLVFPEELLELVMDMKPENKIWTFIMIVKEIVVMLFYVIFEWGEIERESSKKKAIFFLEEWNPSFSYEIWGKYKTSLIYVCALPLFLLASSNMTDMVSWSWEIPQQQTQENIAAGFGSAMVTFARRMSQEQAQRTSFLQVINWIVYLQIGIK